MQKIFIEYIFLILMILFLVMMARKLKVAYPILLVLGGLILSFTSAFSRINIDPELIFFIFLPPLLYDAAWQTSWKEFWKWRRVIMSFAFLIVIVTSCVIAVLSSWLIPGFTLALGFLLGGIISPPDAISATSIMKTVKVPKSLISIVEGESLLNDASSLVVFRFALAAVITGSFVFKDAAVDFFVVIIMGAVVGLIIALFFYAIHRWLPTTARVDIVLSIVTPYCLYYFAERFHYSGVLSVVCGGLFLSSQRQRLLTHQGRIQGATVWSTIGFVLNGIVFMLIGLQLPSIVQQLDISLGKAIGYGLLISLILIVTRLLCTHGTAIFTHFISRYITTADPNPGWKLPLLFGWAGMRGVVSLAAALSIPVYISEGNEFPQRNLILFITFCVILVTLVFQGLTLPWLARKVKLEDTHSPLPLNEQEIIIQKKIAEASIRFLETNHAGDISANEYLKNLHARFRIEARDFSGGGNMHTHNWQQHRLIYLSLLDEQRKLVNQINQESEFDEDLVRKYLTIIDLEESKLRQKQASSSG